jgi:DNA-binding response OmpR family regulator
LLFNVYFLEIGMRLALKHSMARAEEKSNTKKLQGKRILVVEDHPSLGEILIVILRRYGQASQAHSGKDALEQIKHKAPDLILLDLSLPDINGLEVARLVRRNEKTSRIPILAMSGKPMDKKESLEVNCNDFILKPFSISTLLVRLSALTPESVSRTPQFLVCFSLILSPILDSSLIYGQ